MGEPLLSSLPALQSPLREPSPRRPSQPPWPGVVAGLLEALMPTLESSPTRSCYPRSRWQPDVRRIYRWIQQGHHCWTLLTACPHPSLELRSEATISTRTIRTRPLSLCLTLVCTRTTTAGTSTTTFACSPSRDQSAWDPTLQQLACPPAWRSTPR